MPEITVTIGSEADERGVAVTIADDDGWTPDQMTDAANRATTAAVTAWQLLHTPAPS